VGDAVRRRLADAALGIVIFVSLLVLVWYGWLKEFLAW
jgi:hypothetical protein